MQFFLRPFTEQKLFGQRCEEDTLSTERREHGDGGFWERIAVSHKQRERVNPIEVFGVKYKYLTSTFSAI